jgi:hypothetical protein
MVEAFWPYHAALGRRTLGVNLELERSALWSTHLDGAVNYPSGIRPGDQINEQSQECECDG